MREQLTLFSPEAEAERTLREELDHLGAAYAALDDKYRALWQAHKALQQERDKWHTAFQAMQRIQEDQTGNLFRVRRDLANAQRELAGLETYIKTLERCMRSGQAVGTSSPTLESTLKRLLSIVHPDRWSQGQPATALAHELTVTINAVRQQGRGQL